MSDARDRELQKTEPQKYDVLVLGAGAAGLMCAAVAGQRGRRVAVLDHGSLPGRKILISGGGRCNFTNIHCEPGRFLSENPHFAKSALALYTPQHFIELVRRYGIPYHEKTLGQLFCDHSAHAILDILLAECAAARPAVEHFHNAHGIRVQRGAEGFRVECARGDFLAEALVVATGGYSIPKLGATGLGYDIARQFGLGLIEPRAALVPFTLGGEEAGWLKLAGLSASSRVRVGGTAFEEKLLVTHRGLSGPAILQASSYWRPGLAVEVDFAPHAGAGLLGPIKDGRRDAPGLVRLLREFLPQRLAEHLVESSPPSGWSNAALDAWERGLHRWIFHPSGTEGYAKAEVTAGGVDTQALQARTMQARNVPGLYFIGEVVDVTGHLGGFNFQWAWASAVAAGRAV